MKLGIGSFFYDITSFFHSRRVMGIDIGTASVKMVEIAHTGKGYELQNYAILETRRYLDRAHEALQSSSLTLNDEIVRASLATLLKETSPKTKEVVASLPLFKVFVTPIEMPALSKEETARSLNFQARQYVPLAPNEIYVDWTVIDHFTNREGRATQRILLSATPNALLAHYKKLFSEFGLHLLACEPESHALVRVLGRKEDQGTLIIDIGALSTLVMVEEGGVLKYVYQTDYGGYSLTYALAHSLGISPWRAEEIKRRKGILGIGGEQELSTSLLPFIDVILQECERAKSLYERTYGKTIARAVLVGGGAQLPGIDRYITSQMRLSVSAPRSFEYLKYSSSLEPAMQGISKECSLALGLAFRSLF